MGDKITRKDKGEVMRGEEHWSRSPPAETEDTTGEVMNAWSAVPVLRKMSEKGDEGGVRMVHLRDRLCKGGGVIRPAAALGYGGWVCNRKVLG